MADGETHEIDVDVFDPLPEEQQQPEQEQAVDGTAPDPQPAPATNGNGGGHRAPAQGERPRRQLTETIVHPEQDYVPPKPRTAYRPPARREPARNQSFREIIETIVALPESVDWEFQVIRYPGTISVTQNGEPMKRGPLDTYDTMPVDMLHDAIARDWGGGEYKIITRTKSGHTAVTTHPDVRASYLSINCEQYPPRNSKNPTESAALPVEAETEEDQELAEIRMESRRDTERERADRAKSRRMNTELELKRKQREIRDLEKEDKAPQASGLEKILEAMMRQQADDRREANARLDKLGEMILKIAERPAALPPPDKTAEILSAMQTSQNALLGNLLPALVSKPVEKKDDTFELIKYSQEQTRMIMDSFAKQGMKGESAEREMMRSMMAQMIQLVTNPKTGGQAMSVKDTLDLLKSTRKETMDLISQIRGDDGAGGGDETGWDPKKGIAGNLFSMLKDVIGAAVNTPGGQQLLMKFFNTANPTDQDAMALARRMEAEEAQRMMMLPGPQPAQQVRPQMQVMPQQQMRQATIRPQQAPLITPQAPRAQPIDAIPGVAIPPKRAPVVQPQAPAQPPQQAPVVQAVAPAAQPQVTAEQQQAEAQTVLEGEVTGVDDLSGMQPIPDVPQPAPNAAPPTEAIAAPTPASSPVEAAADIQAMPAIQAEVPLHPSQMTPDESELRLMDRVTEAMVMAVTNVKDAIKDHDWPEYAADKWNGKFLRLLIEEPDDVKRGQLIGSRCHQQVWAELTDTLSKSDAEPPQWNAFYNGVRAVVSMAKGE